MAHVIQVIVTDKHCGTGTVANPNRTVVQYWSFDGVLLAERDAWQENEDRPFPDFRWRCGKCNAVLRSNETHEHGCPSGDAPHG